MLASEKMNKPRTKTRKQKAGAVTFETVRQLALELPEVVEGTSYGTPAFRVGGKILARFHQDGESLVLKVEFAAREVLMGAKPDTFYITDHYACWPLMLVRLSRVSIEDLRQLLEGAWRGIAPKRALRAWEAINGER